MARQGGPSVLACTNANSLPTPFHKTEMCAASALLCRAKKHKHIIYDLSLHTVLTRATTITRAIESLPIDDAYAL